MTHHLGDLAIPGLDDAACGSELLSLNRSILAASALGPNQPIVAHPRSGEAGISAHDRRLRDVVERVCVV